MKLTDLNPRYHETIRRQLATQNAAPVRPVSPAVAQPDHARQAASPHPTQARRPRRVVISLLALRRRPLDRDNNTASFKHLQDAIAETLGVDDGDQRLDWQYAQMHTFAQPFKLNIPNHKGNCDLCFLKAKWKLLSIMRENPSSAAWWINWEKKMAANGITGEGTRWKYGTSYESMLADATHPELPLDFSEEDIPCSCAAGAARDDEEDA